METPASLDHVDLWYFGVEKPPPPTPQQLAIQEALRTGQLIRCPADGRYYGEDGRSFVCDPDTG